MEVSPNIDSNLDLDDGEVEEHETKLNRNKAKRRKKSINGRKLDVKMESLPPPLNGHTELTPADDEPEDNMDALNRVSDGWQLSTVGGTDLTRLGAAVSAGGAHVFVAGRGSVLVLAARSGKIVRELNTGEVTAIQRSNSDSEVVVASKNKVVVWDFKEVKVVTQYKFSLHKLSKHEQGLQSVYIPENFHQDHEIFVTVRKKEKKTALHRINLSSGSTHAIFSNVKPGSVHVGDGDNLVTAISDHKEHGFQDATLLVYNKNLAKNMSFHADKERPFTCARVHPASKVVAVGDTSGRIIVYAGLDQAQPSKSILHWHSLPVTVLAWSLEGSVLYSAGAEAVLCKWRQEEGSKPSFVPRIGGAVVGLAAGAGINVVQLDSNKIKMVDTLSDSVLCSVSGLARNQRGYPAGLQSDRDRLVMNGGTGLVQVYRPATDTVHSYDITQQNLVTKERVCEPHNSEVEAVAVSRDGGFMATVDCLWSDIPRVLLKLWHWSEETNNYRLNTQVETPHAGGVQTMAFQPSTGSGPLLLTVGGDKSAKVWQLGSSWACVACLTFRQLPATGGDWSSDGTLLAVSFQHLVTLWAGAGADTRLVSTLALDTAPQPVTSLVFGRNSCSRYLYTATAARTVIWDLVTSAPCWSLPLAPSPHTTLAQAEHLPLLAIVQKSCITIVSPPSRTVVATISDVNCTGGAAWLARDLYCLTYCGELVRASRDPRPAVARAAVLQQPGSRVSSWLAAPRGSAGGGAEQGAGLVATPGPRRDIESLLALPLHTLPAPAQLATSLIR